MGKCEARVYAFGTLRIDLQVSKSGAVMVPQTTLNLPRFTLDSPDPPPPTLKFAGQRKAQTQSLSTGGAFDEFGYTGSILSALTLDWEMNFYCDCDGPYCIKGTVKGIKAELLYEFPVFGGAHAASPNLSKTTVTSPDIAFGEDCSPPKWTLCCSDDVTVDMELDKHALVPDKLQLTIEDAEATVHYEVWHRHVAPENSHASFERAELRQDGSTRFALRSNSVRSTAPLPRALGGESVTVSSASGYVVVRPGRQEGCVQQLEVIELSYIAPSIKLAHGETGPIEVALAPEARARGEINHCTGLVRLDVPQVIHAPLLGEQAVYVQSQVTGFYDHVSGVAEIVTFSFDTFPELPPASHRDDKERGR